MFEVILAVATLLGGVTALWFLVDKILVGPRRVYYPETNEEFYTFYASSIRAAQSSIWITSDGFNLRNPQSLHFAQLMTNAFRDALDRGVAVHRFQITSTMHLNWLPELAALKRDYPDLFHLYVNLSLSNVPNVCAIDPDTSRCLAERMEHRAAHFGQGSEAATYTFIRRNKQVASQTRSIVEDAIRHSATEELEFDDVSRLADTLLEMRVAALRAWRESLPTDARVDLALSGVFDEQVISEFLARIGTTRT